MSTAPPPRVLLFDFLGTLVRPLGGVEPPRFDAVAAQHGHVFDPIVFGRWHHRFQGASHRRHSSCEADYDVWFRGRLELLLELANVAAADRPALLAALIDAGAAPAVEPYPDAPGALAALRSAGIGLAICANWGWRLDTAVAGAGLAGHVDAVVASARTGARKPNSEPYLTALHALACRPAQAIAVGASWGTDILGPTALGMGAVHLWRPADHVGQEPPVLRPGIRRIGALDDLVEMFA